MADKIMTERSGFPFSGIISRSRKGYLGHEVIGKVLHGKGDDVGLIKMKEIASAISDEKIPCKLWGEGNLLSKKEARSVVHASASVDEKFHVCAMGCCHSCFN